MAFSASHRAARLAVRPRTVARRADFSSGAPGASLITSQSARFLGPLPASPWRCSRGSAQRVQPRTSCSSAAHCAAGSCALRSVGVTRRGRRHGLSAATMGSTLSARHRAAPTRRLADCSRYCARRCAPHGQPPRPAVRTRRGAGGRPTHNRCGADSAIGYRTSTATWWADRRRSGDECDRHQQQVDGSDAPVADRNLFEARDS